MKPNQFVAYGLVVVVVCVWAATYLATIWDHSYQPPPGLTELMMTVAGFVVTGKFIGVLDGKRKDKEYPDSKPNDTDPRSK